MTYLFMYKKDWGCKMALSKDVLEGQLDQLYLKLNGDKSIKLDGELEITHMSTKEIQTQIEILKDLIAKIDNGGAAKLSFRATRARYC